MEPKPPTCGRELCINRCMFARTTIDKYRVLAKSYPILAAACPQNQFEPLIITDDDIPEEAKLATAEIQAKSRAARDSQ